MAFTPAPTSTSYPYTPISTPYRAEFTLTDDGGGGQLFINGQGYTGADLLDLKTFFGAAFVSTFLLSKFLGNAATSADLNTAAFFKNIDVSLYQISTGLPSRVLPVVVALRSGPVPNGVPGFNVVGPGATGVFRLTLRLRHTMDT